MPDKAIEFYYYQSPIGTIKIEFSKLGISSLVFTETRILTTKNSGKGKDCFTQLEEYFEGSRESFDLPLDIHGTDFQKRVWRELRKIPFGSTTNYFSIARQLGDSKINRAVGNANSKNPVSIIIPCHRVIGSNGDLTGYAGGLWRKKWLLEHEQKLKQLSLF